MGDSMMIKPNKKLAGAPRVGEVGEVDRAYGEMLVERGHAIDATELHQRLSLTPEERYLNSTKAELKKEAKARGLSTDGVKADIVARLLEDDEAPEDDLDYRDAGTGQYVTEEYADEHPGTTVSESE